MISTDAGQTWDFVDPTPGDGGGLDVYDVIVHNGGIIDVCGQDGHQRSTDGGAAGKDYIDPDADPTNDIYELPNNRLDPWTKYCPTAWSPPAAASAAPTLQQVVVFPTPPFWLMTAI